MLPTASLRALTVADCGPPLQWLDTLPDNPWSTATLVAALAKPHYCVRVAIDTAQDTQALVGVSVATIIHTDSQTNIDTECNLLYIAVQPELRQQGLGSALIEDLQAQCSQQSVRRLLLEVRADNTEAIALYLNSGFVLDGVRKNYYPARQNTQQGVSVPTTAQRQDALLFSCQI